MKRRGTKVRAATRKRQQKRTRRMRGGDAENNARRAYFEGIRLLKEKNAFMEQIKKVANEQAGSPRVKELLELLRMFNQSTELIKHQRMRDEVSMKLRELEKYELDGELKNKVQSMIAQIQRRIADYEARI